MNRNNLIGWIFLVICTIAAPLHAQNSVKVKGAQGRWQVSPSIIPWNIWIKPPSIV